MSELIFPTINLAILIAIIVIYLREPLRTFVHARHENLRGELQRVRDMLTTAQTKHSEFSSKLKAMEAEIQSLREQARQDASASKSRIVAEAQKLSATIITDARTASQGLFSRLREELFADVGGKVLDRAEAMLKDRLTGDDRARIRNEFSAQVESVQ